MERSGIVSRKVAASVLTGKATLLAPAVGLALRPSAVQAAPACVGTFSNQTIAGNLEVPAGQTCNLDKVTVTGNLTVDANATLNTRNTVIDGSLIGLAGAQVTAKHGSVQGNASFRGSSSASGCDVVIGGNLTVDQVQQHFFIDKCNPYSKTPALTSVGGNLVIVNQPGGYDQSLTGKSHIHGNLVVASNAGTVSVFSSTFGGSASISGNTGYVDLYSNRFGGSGTFTRNTGQINVSSNRFGGGITCSGNSNPPNPSGSGNSVAGSKSSCPAIT